MNLFGTEIDGPMVVIRAIHFAATAIAAGAVIFRMLVAAPSLHSAPILIRAAVERRIRAVMWISLAIAVVTGLIWLLQQTVSMSGQPLGEAISSGAFLDVVNATGFGFATEVRLLLAMALAICLAYERIMLLRWFAFASAIGLVAAIAWTGHAASTPSELGYMHLASDALHLTAAATWLGGLICLALLLSLIRGDQALASQQFDAVRRFSALGIASVAALITSGIISAWILVGSIRALVGSDYGRLLMLKLAAFAVMLAFAAANRVWLTPQLAPAVKTGERSCAAHALTRNTMFEIALGFLIFCIVGVLGTLHPAVHLVK
jgi:putative copper resistance protein D